MRRRPGRPGRPAATVVVGILSCRASECCAGGSNSVSARFVRGNGAGGDAAAGCDLRADPGASNAAPGRAGPAYQEEGDRRDRSRPLPRLMQLPAVQAAAAVARDASHASGFWRCQEHRTGDAARSLAPRLPHAGTASQICGAPDAQAPANRGRPRAWTCRNTPDGAGAGLHGAQNLRASPPTGCRRGRQWQRRRASPRCAQQGIFGNRAGQHGRQDRRRGAGAVDHV